MRKARIRLDKAIFIAIKYRSATVNGVTKSNMQIRLK